MFDEKDLLIDGERQLGQYTVVILRQTGSGNWSPDLMQLYTLVTNYRLMLRPHRKKYAPASLPARYIQQVEMTRVGRYHCVVLQLITNHYLYLILSTGKLEDLHDDIKAMTSPPPRFQFDETVARRDIERLITFFGQQPLNGSVDSV